MNHLYIKNEIHFIIKTIGDFLPIINQSCENRDFVTGSCYSGLHSIVEIGALLDYNLQTLVKGTIFVKIITTNWNNTKNILNNAQEREDDEEGLILYLMLFKMLTIKDFPLNSKLLNAKYMYSVPYILSLFCFCFSGTYIKIAIRLMRYLKNANETFVNQNANFYFISRKKDVLT